MNASGDYTKNAQNTQARGSSVSGCGRAFAAAFGGLGVAAEDIGRKTPKKARL